MQNSARTKPRTKPSEERREDLMNSAIRVFLKSGVAATTIDQITAGAKVAKGTFYLHFESKEDLVRGLRQRFTREFLARIDAALGEQEKDDWEGKLATWTSECVNAYLDAVQVHDIIFHEVHADSREERTDNLVFEHLAGLLAQGDKAGVWSVEDTLSTAIFVFSGIHGIVDDTLIREKRVNRTRLIQRATGLGFRTVGLKQK